MRVELRVGDKVGDIAREIISFAEGKRVDLIAISSHGHSGVAKWVFGSIAQKVLQASSLPVLVVRAGGQKA